MIIQIYFYMIDKGFGKLIHNLHIEFIIAHVTYTVVP